MRILIIRFSSLGDVVLASAVIDALRDAFPTAKLILLVGAAYADLYEDDPRLDGVFRFQRSGRNARAEIRSLREIVGCLQEQAFDAIVDLQGSFRSRMICSRLLAGRKVRYAKRHWTRVAMVRAKWLPLRPVSTVQAYLAALNGLGLPEGLRSPRLIVAPESVARAEERLRALGVGPEDHVVGIAPGALWPGKRWTSEGFAAVADALLEGASVRVAFLGDETDRDVVGAIVKQMARRSVILTGMLDLKTLAAVIQRCSVLLTNDSGPMHLATAVGTPAVAVFGPTHPKLGFAPSGPHDRVVTLDLPCSPCTLHGKVHCPYSTRRCMEGIAAELVLREIVQQLERLETDS